MRVLAAMGPQGKGLRGRPSRKLRTEGTYGIDRGGQPPGGRSGVQEGGWGGRGLQPHTQEPKQRSCDITGEPASLAGTAQSGDQEVQVPLPLALVSSGTWLGLTEPSMSSAGKPQRDIGNPESTSVFSWGSNETKFLKAQPHSLPPASTNSKVATGQLSR